MKYVPYFQLRGVPHVIVDGAAQEDTVLTLSHWPGSESPAEFRADTSTEIVLNYLATPGAQDRYAPDVQAVSNNHFDVDGLCAVWAMLYPGQALAQRTVVVDVAAAGDFSIYRRPQAAKVVFTIHSYADAHLYEQLERPAPAGPSADATGARQYEALLPLLESFLEKTDRYGPYWADEWDAMLRSKTAMVTGQVELREIPHVDLAVAQAPEPLHPMVLYNSTERLRVLTALPGGFYHLRYRYESWVQFASRPVMPRVDLAPFLPRLQELERGDVRWIFEGNAATTPSLQPLDPGGEPGPSSLSLDVLLDELIAFYEQEQDNPALQWDPYASAGYSVRPNKAR